MKTKLLIFSLLLSNILVAQITEVGQASFYADKFDGRITASGEVFKQNKLTAAHRTLPFGSTVRVINLQNNRSVIVTINDRGPFVNNRVIDLSKKAAQQLDFIKTGVAKVRVEVISIAKGKGNTTGYKPTPTKNNTQTITEEPTPQPEAEVTPTPQPKDTQTTQTEQAKTYYKVDTQTSQPKGYGIQVASYREVANLIKICADIKQLAKKDVFVQIKESNGNKLYKVIVGTFSSHQQAEQFKDILKSKFNGCFIVEF